MNFSLSDVESASPELAVIRAPQVSKVIDASTVNLKRGSDITPHPINWLWNGWLPIGKLVLLAGMAGNGKTSLSMAMAAVVTRGGTWPDRTACQIPGNVIIWSGEDDPQDTLVPRLIAAGCDMDRIFFITGVTRDGRSMSFDPSVDIHDLHKAVTTIGGVSLLIIDPIVSVVAGNMHHANDVRRSLQCLVEFAAVHSSAVIGITHFAKGTSGNVPVERVLGSQAFGALARMVLVAAKKDGEEMRVLARAKSNIGPDDGGFAYGVEVTRINDGIEATRVIWQGALHGSAAEILGSLENDVGDDAKSDAERYLSDLLSDGPLPQTQIKRHAAEAGYSMATIRRAKKSLRIQSVKGGFSKSPEWCWELPTKMLKACEGAQAHSLSTFEHLRADLEDEGFEEVL